MDEQASHGFTILLDSFSGLDLFFLLATSEKDELHTFLNHRPNSWHPILGLQETF